MFPLFFGWGGGATRCTKAAEVASKHHFVSAAALDKVFQGEGAKMLRRDFVQSTQERLDERRRVQYVVLNSDNGDKKCRAECLALKRHSEPDRSFRARESNQQPASRVPCGPFAPHG